MQDLTGKTIVLYDGVCGLCNRLVRLLLRFDRKDRFRYAALQSEFAVKTLQKHGIDSADLDSVTLIASYGMENERSYFRSDAILLAIQELGGIWRVAGLAAAIPKSVRNRVYDLIAHNRYRLFGRYPACPVPKPEEQAKFVVQNSTP